MNITSAQYINDPLSGEANVGILATIDGTEMTVPVDEGNRHYQEILKWVAEGNTIQEAD